MTLPAWAPDLAAVASYITSRTLDNALPGDPTPTGSFNVDTYPTDAQVTGLIPGSCQWVTVATGTIDAALYEAAAACAALRTAALIELSFPTRDAEVSIAETMLAQALALRTDLAGANIAITGVDPSTSAHELVPQWTMPDPVWHGDYNTIGS